MIIYFTPPSGDTFKLVYADYTQEDAERVVAAMLADYDEPCYYEIEAI